VRLLPLLAAGLALAGCGASGTFHDAAPTEPSPAPAERASPSVYEANATVLEDRRGRPMLCLHAIAASLPPQCGDVPITNWDWARVEGEESLSGTTWGTFHVTGTYDGETFTVLEIGPPASEPPVVEETFGPACDDPTEGEGGGRRSDLEAGNVDAWASRQPTYVASWVTYLVRPTMETDEMSLPVLFNVVVSGGAAAVEAGIRERWDGQLCVVERDAPPLREARRIRAEAEALLPELGLQMLGSDEGGVEQAARITVVADPDGKGQAAMDERFGPGLVLLEPVLRPVP
jgi:hypothetical protein